MSASIPTDSLLRLVGCVDDGSTLTWQSETASAHDSAIRDVDGDGVLDAGTDFFGGINYPFTGYYAMVGGKPYAVFANGFSPSICYIPYDSTQDDLSAFVPLDTRTAEEISEDITTTTSFCFATGTRLATPTGETPVEALRLGDLVCTADGAIRPVTWIGWQRVQPSAVNLPLPAHRLPVRIAKGTLGATRDLIVSADHGLVFEDCVINAAALINGDSIRFATAREMGRGFTYWHIETARHEALLANGVPAETFFDAAGRRAFDNYAAYLAHYGVDQLIPEMRRPRITSARLVPQRLQALLGVKPAGMYA